MPLDLNCPRCEKVFAVTEARHPVGVQCPGCDAELTAEFRRVPVPNPGESPYELLVTPGRPKDAPSPAAGKKPLPLDDDDRGHGGGSMAMVIIVGLTALVLTLGGLGVTGYVLFTNLDTTPSYSSRGASSTSGGNTGGTRGGNKGGNKGGFPGGGIIPGGGNPGGGIIPGGGNPPPPPPRKVDRFNLNPVSGPLPAFTPTPFDASGASAINLPGKADSISVGGAGRYVVMHFPEKGELAVVDVCAARVVAQKEADAGPVKLAAGLSRLVVWAPAARVFRVYDLPNLEKLYDAKCELFHGPQAMGMGSRTNGPLLAVDPFGEVVLHDVSKPDAPVVEASKGQPGVHAGHGGGLRVSRDGRVFATFDGLSANHKVTLLTESVGKWKVTRDTHPAPFPSERGDLFYGNGGAMDRNGRSVNLRGVGFGSNQWFLPATSGDYFLKLATAKQAKGPGPNKTTYTLTVHRARNAESLVGNVPPIGNIDTEGLIDVWGNVTAPLDQHFIFVPEAKALVFIPGTRDRVHFRKMDPR